MSDLKITPTMNTFDMPDWHTSALELVLSYTEQNTPIQALHDLVHDSDQDISDGMRGRDQAFTFRTWYKAYEILCYKANVIPIPVNVFRSGNYIYPNHAGAYELVGGTNESK